MRVPLPLHRPATFSGPTAPAARSWFGACASAFVAGLLLATLVSAPRTAQPPAPVKVAHASPTTARATTVSPAMASATTVSPATASATTASATTPQPVIHVLFVGASITSGMQQTSLGDTYPGKVVEGLQDRGLRVDWQERARWGATVFDALRWPYPGDQQVIVVHLITNDFLAGTSLVRYQQALRQVLVDLRERSPEANLICLGTWQQPGTVNRARVPLQSFDTAAREGCASQHGEFVPLDRIFAARGSRGPVGQDTPWGPADGFHPNDVGAQMIANAVLAEIPNGN